MIDRLDLLLQGCRILHRHILHNDHGKGTHTKLIYHDILSLNRLKTVREITQNIIIHSRRNITDPTWNQQDHSKQNNDIFMLGDKFCKFLHDFPSFLFSFFKNDR